MRRNKPWDRLLWAVWFHGLKHQDGGFICGAAWHPRPGGGFARSYEHEPTRAMVFTTRKQARDCRTALMAKHAPDWRFSVVRVRELVEVA